MTEQAVLMPQCPAADEKQTEPGDGRDEELACRGDELVGAELLVEEVSIDGMCGVY
jgi:mycofactocin precursor